MNINEIMNELMGFPTLQATEIEIPEPDFN